MKIVLHSRPILGLLAFAVVALLTGFFEAPQHAAAAWQCTWVEQTASGARNWGDIASSDDGTKLVAGVTNGYNYTSTDSGATWTQRTGPDGQFFTVAIESSADGGQLISGPSEGYPYVSANSGASWSYGHNIGLKWRDFASSDNGQIVVAGTMTYLYTSTNAGTTFTSRTGPGQRWWAGVDVSSDGTKQVAAARTYTTGGTGRLYRSTDSGVNWSQLGGAGLRDYSDIASSDDGTQLVATVYGGYIYTSTDGGINWTERTSAGSQQWENVAMSSDGTVIAATVDVGNVYVSFDSGATWDAQTVAGSQDWGEIAMSSDGTKIATAVYGGYIYTATCAPLNTAPNAPTITGTSTGYANMSDTFSFSDSIDPEGDTIRYAVDWDNNGLTDEYVPVTGYVPSGTSQNTTYAWSVTGNQTFKVRAEDDKAASSTWATHTIAISAPPPTVLVTVSSNTYIQYDPAITLMWSSSDATSCTGTNFSTGGATSSSAFVTPTTTTTYTVSCTGPGGSASSSETVVYICVPNNICSGTDVVNSCNNAVVTSCAPGTCSAGACVPSPAIVIGALTADPAYVRPNNPSNLRWDITNASSCSVTGINGDSWTGLQSGVSGQESSPIIGITTYTLNCIGDDGSILMQTTTVRILPTVVET